MVSSPTPGPWSRWWRWCSCLCVKLQVIVELSSFFHFEVWSVRWEKWESHSHSTTLEVIVAGGCQGGLVMSKAMFMTVTPRNFSLGFYPDGEHRKVKRFFIFVIHYPNLYSFTCFTLLRGRLTKYLWCKIIYLMNLINKGIHLSLFQFYYLNNTFN